ncbi:hypothetical protein ACUL41_08780 [Virgibacillus natechei]|uniref:hypothetical protein n=1 Tax=Virgibacillus sp. CBA3643 TaxID=2942278 RepID=UPI0035A32B54
MMYLYNLSIYRLASEKMENRCLFLLPVAIGVLLVKQLISERFLIILRTLYAILGSIIFSEIPGSLNVEAEIYFFFSN